MRTRTHCQTLGKARNSCDRERDDKLLLPGCGAFRFRDARITDRFRKGRDLRRVSCLLHRARRSCDGDRARPPCFGVALGPFPARDHALRR